MERNGNSGHREVKHTADIGFEVWSDTLIGIIIESFEGIRTLIGYTCLNENFNEAVYKTVDGDFEDQLIAFLNEIIYLLDQGIAVKSITVAEKNEHFDISMNCCKLGDCELLVKAVTYGGARLLATRDGYQMEIVIDV